MPLVRRRVVERTVNPDVVVPIHIIEPIQLKFG